MTLDEYLAEGERRFGADKMAWAWVCPCCSHEQTAQHYKDAGAPESAVAFSCVGRWSGAKREAFAEGAGPCNYAGGGLIGLNPTAVVTSDGKEHRFFAFAEPSREGGGA